MVPLLGWWNSRKLQNVFVLQPLRTWWLNFQGVGEVWYTPLKILPSQKESNGKQSSKKNIFQRLCPKLHGCNWFIRISTKQCNVLVLISSQTTQHNKPLQTSNLETKSSNLDSCRPKSALLQRTVWNLDYWSQVKTVLPVGSAQWRTESTITWDPDPDWENYHHHFSAPQIEKTSWSIVTVFWQDPIDIYTYTSPNMFWMVCAWSFSSKVFYLKEDTILQMVIDFQGYIWNCIDILYPHTHMRYELYIHAYSPSIRSIIRIYIYRHQSYLKYMGICTRVLFTFL